MNAQPVFEFSPADLPGFGLPEDRQARIAARRAFVELKSSFKNAATVPCGPTADLLRQLDSVFPDSWPETSFVPL